MPQLTAVYLTHLKRGCQVLFMQSKAVEAIESLPAEISPSQPLDRQGRFWDPSTQSLTGFITVSKLAACKRFCPFSPRQTTSALPFGDQFPGYRSHEPDNARGIAQALQVHVSAAHPCAPEPHSGGSFSSFMPGGPPKSTGTKRKAGCLALTANLAVFNHQRYSSTNTSTSTGARFKEPGTRPSASHLVSAPWAIELDSVRYTQPVGFGRPAILHAPLPGPEGNSS